MKYAQKQLEAINTNKDKVLVAAAAGSGKTSVMAKRIARLIKDGCDITCMLVMTFTKAATLQMKQKIARELYEEGTRCKDKRLFLQSELVASGDISTFHGFCANIVRQNYNVCGVLPNFRILEESKAEIMRAKVAREMFDILYQNHDEDFLRLLARYTKRSNDSALAVYIFKIYGYIMSKPYEFLWINKTISKDINEYISVLKAEYTNNLFEMLKKAKDLFYSAYLLESDEDEKQALREQQNIDYIENIINHAQTKGFETLQDVFPQMNISRFSMKGDSKELIKKLREEGKSYLKEVLNDEYIQNFEDIALFQLEHTQKDVVSIVKLTQMFANMYKKQKSDENALDYEDLQHFALIALKENREFYTQKYKYIFIDEYQDTNPIQEEIINMVNVDNNLFMVGDIKQSIYKFRLADPSIFRSKSQNFQGENLINMNENFRSKSEIIKCVNGVFKAVMSQKVGEITYDAQEQLIGNFEGGEVRLILCTKNEEDKYITQAKAIAQSIKQIIGNIMNDRGEMRQITFDDIAIIIRSRSEIVSAIKGVFIKEEIPCVIDTGEEQLAIELFMNILRIIDNPQNDIALLSVMRSIFWGFDENDFAQVRIYNNKQEFYFAAHDYMKNNNDDLAERLLDFFTTLNDLNIYKNAHTLKEFIFEVINKFDFELYIATLINSPKESFDKFLDLLLANEDDLYTLIQTLNDIKKRKSSYVDAKQNNTNGVKVLTVHGAKGLEFSVVYIVHLDKKFNESDLQNDFVIDAKYGIMPKYVDEENFIKKQTIERITAKKRHLLEMKSEELRILYVAMTRAMDKLFLIGYGENLESDFEKWQMMDAENAQNLLDFIMCSHSMKYEIYTPKVSENKETFLENDKEKFSEDIILLELNKQISVPAKMSVSAIKKIKSKKKFFTPSIENTDEISGARLGTLIHSVMEKDTQDAMKTAQEMLENKIITDEEFKAIAINSPIINAFYKSDIYARILKSKKVLKEQNFYIKLNGKTIGYDSDEQVLVQGIIDLAFLENNKWVIVDYKTDKVTHITLKETANSYKTQLDLYSQALSTISGIQVKECYLYFLRLNKSVLLR